MITVDRLKELFEVREDQDLAPVFGRKKGAVSVWRKTGVPAAIERRASELLAMRGIAMNTGNQQSVTIGETRIHYDDEITAAVAKIMRELSPKGRYEVMHFAAEVRMKENGTDS